MVFPGDTVCVCVPNTGCLSVNVVESFKVYRLIGAIPIFLLSTQISARGRVSMVILDDCWPRGLGDVLDELEPEVRVDERREP